MFLWQRSELNKCKCVDDNQICRVNYVFIKLAVYYGGQYKFAFEEVIVIFLIKDGAKYRCTFVNQKACEK